MSPRVSEPAHTRPRRSISTFMRVDVRECMPETPLISSCQVLS